MEYPSTRAVTRSSRDRLIDAAVDLFATRGFSGTTVGDIEAAAGFSPRAGTLYKHFPAKLAILEAVVERHIDGVDGVRRIADLLPRSDPVADITLVLRALLVELDTERAITAVLEKEGSSFPELRERFYRRLVEPGYRDAATLIERLINGSHRDAEALAVIAVGAIVNHHRNRWTFDAVALDVDGERIISELVQILTAPAPP